MSRAAKQSIIILIVLILAAMGFSFFTLLEKEKIIKEKISLEHQLEEYRSREKTNLLENKNLQEKLVAVEKEKTDLAAKLSNFGGNIEDMDLRIKKIATERDDLKKKFEEAKAERDRLAVKLQDNAQQQAALPLSAAQETTEAKTELKPEDLPGLSGDNDESYWAQVLKEKAALQLDLDDVKRDLSKSTLEVAELKKQNTDLQLEISKLNDEKDAIGREIKYGNDLANSLSIELARAQNDKKFMLDRLDKLVSENGNLHEHIKQLTSTKIGLEKNIVKLEDDKKTIEKKLLETENIIQNRIDQIWELKEGLQNDFKPSVQNPKTGAIELSPIIVDQDQLSGDVSEPQPIETGVNGNVISVNDENNFVIVNLGQDTGLQLGDKLNVYRGAEYIAGLEIIQVRKDIAAADIKNKMTQIEVGDSVR